MRGPRFKYRTSPYIFLYPFFLKEKKVYFSTKGSPSSVCAILRAPYVFICPLSLPSGKIIVGLVRDLNRGLPLYHECHIFFICPLISPNGETIVGLVRDLNPGQSLYNECRMFFLFVINYAELRYWKRYMLKLGITEIFLRRVTFFLDMRHKSIIGLVRDLNPGPLAP